MPNEIKALNPLINNRELTETGAGWMVQTLDPFHDTNQRPVGYPDLTNGSSFIQTVVLTHSDAILGPTDFHIFSLPMLTTREMYQYPTQLSEAVEFQSQAVQYCNAPVGGYTGRLGPLNISAHAPGVASMPYYNTATNLWTPVDSTVNNIFSFDLDPYLIGSSRLVSMAFEVINTGPELLKSGAIVTYRSPQNLVPSHFTLDLDPTENMNHPCTRVNMPPAFASDALLLPGSQQWDAYEGAYVVNSLASVSNPAIQPDMSDPLVEANRRLDSTGTYSIDLLPRASSLFPQNDEPTQLAPWNTSGAFVTGAQVGTTLTVVLKAYIECFPTPDMKSYVTLTTPASPYDPEALELYAKTSFSLKPGTPAKNNAGGDHFRLVSDIVTAVAPRVGSAMQIARPLGRAVTAGAKAIQANREKKSGKQENKTFGRSQTNARATGRPDKGARGRRRA